jgi:predicted kinase
VLGDRPGARQGTGMSLPMASAELSSVWKDHLRALAVVQHTILDPVRLARLNSLAQRYLAGRTAVLDARRLSGAESGVEPLDELGRLVLDLEYSGQRDLVAPLFGAYREFSGDVFPASLAHHYIALEATARARRAVAEGQAGETDAASRARALVLLALRHLDMGRIHLVLIGGEPGTGKSTLAARLADACGWMSLSSVQVRAGASGGGQPLGLQVDWTSGRRDPALAAAAYAEMLRRAGLLLERGQSVIVDATWSDRSLRATAAAVAGAASADLALLRCDAGETLREARIRDRIAAGPAIADAAVSICRRIAADFQPWPEATIIDTRQPVWCSLATALRAIGTTVPSAPGPAHQGIVRR